MLLLLPPSEGKALPRRGRPVDLGGLVAPELTPQREALLDALEALARGPREDALAALGLSEAQAGELALDARLRSAPAATADRVYTGVLFERLRLGELRGTARRRARERVLIASGLWGVLRPGDRIPAYRLPIGARLPGLGGLAAFWRPALTAALPADGLVVDLRSSGYAAAWRPPEATLVPVRAWAEQTDGTRTVISHMAKRVRGDVARALLEAPRMPRDGEGVLAVARAAGLRAELAEQRGGAALDVIEPAPSAA